MTDYALQSRDGFAAHLLRSEEVEVEVIPALGAKISSLRSLRTGREWMWSPPEARLFANGPADAFEASTLIGADECFPTVGACRWRDRDLPDHGEVWSRAWQVSADAQGIRTFISCPLSPFAFQRHVSLQGNAVTLAYEVKNTGGEEEAYSWAFHPLLRPRPSDRIDLPTSFLRADMSIAAPFGGWEEGWHRLWKWPRPLDGVDWEAIDFGPYGKAAVKLFTETLDEGRAALANEETGERLEFRFALSEIDTVGLWINRGGWNGFDHVAIEPTVGAPDRLDVAATAGPTGRCRRLAAGAAASWTLTLRLN